VWLLQGAVIVSSFLLLFHGSTSYCSISIHLLLIDELSFISISLPRNTGSRKFYGYKFSGKQAHPSESVLG
jgi:hypothetical protein